MQGLVHQRHTHILTYLHTYILTHWHPDILTSRHPDILTYWHTDIPTSYTLSHSPSPSGRSCRRVGRRGIRSSADLPLSGCRTGTGARGSLRWPRRSSPSLACGSGRGVLQLEGDEVLHRDLFGRKDDKLAEAPHRAACGLVVAAPVVEIWRASGSAARLKYKFLLLIINMTEIKDITSERELRNIFKKYMCMVS